MLLSLFAYTFLVFLLAMSNWDRVLVALSWTSSLASRWLTTSTILSIYGIVLIYLLLVVHGLAARQSPRARRGSTLAPYYDENGQLQGWVREERKKRVIAPPRQPSTSPPPRGRATPALSARAGPTPASSSLESWDGFPDDRFQCHFTRQQVEDTSRLAVYWIFDKLPGKSGSTNAVTPEKGRLSHFRCAGVIHCKTAVCTVQIAPGSNIARQLEALCNCGSPLRHRPCDVEWSVVFYRDGAVFENGGPHNHSKYTHSLPVSRRKRPELQEFLCKQPIALRRDSSYSPTRKDDDFQGNFDPPEGHATEEDGTAHGSPDGFNSEDEWNSHDERELDPTADEDVDEEEKEENTSEEDGEDNTT
ncbi:hypothetical protein B0H16DRAFT_1620622 [Mycena metata]|uniref:Uncharacterized protein n=1 Tax=Mycena metata TaxID=1033252 RepID=A0AAD7H6K5_9AGAR|nr:hypothetical protein B0H16DRAFT_1620622 [Mycena metata]